MPRRSRAKAIRILCHGDSDSVPRQSEIDGFVACASLLAPLNSIVDSACGPDPALTCIFDCLSAFLTLDGPPQTAPNSISDFCPVDYRPGDIAFLLDLDHSCPSQVEFVFARFSAV